MQMNDVGEKKSFARKPQYWNTNPVSDGEKSPFGRKLPARCMLTGVPVLPPTPVSPLTKAFIVTLEPTFFGRDDGALADDPVYALKKEFIEKTGW